MAQPTPNKLILGNWKMNGTRASSESLVQAIKNWLSQNPAFFDRASAAVCPPTPLLATVASLLPNSRLELGAQDCHPQPSGAFTGDVSAEMLKDAGCKYVIVGHSERRQLHGEKSELVALKAAASHRAGLIPVICVGETLEERQNSQTNSVVVSQIKGSLPPGNTLTPDNIVIAYEPVWAIGTGKVATESDIAEVHKVIRETLPKSLNNVKILYGGSVKAQNAKAIMATSGVDGALVGGASLAAEEFCSILSAVL